MGRKAGKNYKRAAAMVDSTINYSKQDAAQLVKDASFAKFDEAAALDPTLDLVAVHEKARELMDKYRDESD